MGKKGFAAVRSSFFDEASRAFEFLVSDFGLNGPELRTVLLPSVRFTGGGVRYAIRLDTGEKNVITDVEIDFNEKRLIAELPDLVQAAGIGARNHVTSKATSLNALQNTLELHARYLRQLQPLMQPDKILGLMRAAEAREWS
ncbi:hypothetical protein AB0368_07155 [Actinoplanes sp. NPDC051475]|uniref:hypothetical protein n=1 Tax=Actinoplanes sp. NPDC051475 TaxID=3157225 RepID=UPI00344DE441